ncbi:hypothetical protein PN498_00685 [Oscillatoria sp. CS-180]|uniref:hypothetical protein n=1 Tax=Oscillatoria sp. CS-180 TaxID=3021720 RepID=UPI00232EB385|nr:hypothetical protein [Oscillatoria sp. CS-180]MDB9524488.1 hypothetical protein [Oscillatoria sp. CS-180]
MPEIAPRLSETELSQRILDMAKTGVYRESIFEAFQSLATKRQVSSAIAHAKQLGLYSVSSLRDPDLGTYYQVDLAKYQSLQAALKANIQISASDDLAAQILITTQTIRAMLVISGGFTLVLVISGGFLLLTGHLQSGRFAWVGAACVGGVWSLQQYWTRLQSNH